MGEQRLPDTPETQNEILDTEETAGVEQENSKRFAKKTIGVLCISCAVLLLLNFLTSVNFNKLWIWIFGENEPTFTFEYPDFDEDILADPAYLSLERKMAIRTDGQTIWLNDEDYALQESPIRCLREYFRCAVFGDLHGYNLCFTENYHEENGGARTDPFTMQRVYDIVVERLGQTIESQDGTVRRVYYQVEYKIQRNNGTFRDDVGSDGVRPQVFEMIRNTQTNECKIDKITLLGKFEGIPQED